MYKVADEKNKAILGVILSAITLVTIIITTIGLSPILLLSIQQQQSTEAKVEAASEKNRTVAPAADDIAVSADNIYVVWWSNKTTSSSTTGEGDWEVFFRASTDGGKTWGDKMNLSNSKGIVSNNAQVAAEAQGKSVYVTWWESNENVNPYTNEPVMRISTDEGKTFGPILKLDSNSAIGSSSISQS
jgi:hypothetical protein